MLPVAFNCAADPTTRARQPPSIGAKPARAARRSVLDRTIAHQKHIGTARLLGAQPPVLGPHHGRQRLRHALPRPPQALAHAPAHALHQPAADAAAMLLERREARRVPHLRGSGAVQSAAAPPPTAKAGKAAGGGSRHSSPAHLLLQRRLVLHGRPAHGAREVACRRPWPAPGPPARAARKRPDLLLAGALQQGRQSGGAASALQRGPGRRCCRREAPRGARARRLTQPGLPHGRQPPRRPGPARPAPGPARPAQPTCARAARRSSLSRFLSACLACRAVLPSVSSSACGSGATSSSGPCSSS